MSINEKFIFNNNELDFGILDLWKSKYSNVFNMQDVIAEFLVEKALVLIWHRIQIIGLCMMFYIEIIV